MANSLAKLLKNQAQLNQQSRLLAEEKYAKDTQEYITGKTTVQPKAPKSLVETLKADQIKAGKPKSRQKLGNLIENLSNDRTFLAQVNTNWNGKIISAGVVIKKSTGQIIHAAPILQKFQKAGLNYKQLCYLIHRRGGLVINLETGQVEE